MIKHVGSVCVFVSDHQRAKSFYLEQLGMELRQEDEMPDDSGDVWISVAPPGESTEIVLYKQGHPAWSHYESTYGAVQSITLSTEDLTATVRELHSRGVKISQEPAEHQWGGFAIIEDSEGNSLILVQPNS